ncbi:MAG: hypothetical protein M3541_11995 [Acidobacteriota bacterium]|nr:hypothetical protein [Acidobacteriota bacterium]MDQ3419483.1 hypothetical protein [Acidobacteriota bacterium]
MIDDTNPLDTPPGMIDDTNPLTPLAKRITPEAAPTSETPREPADAQIGPSSASAAMMKFKSCRWKCDPDAGEYCTHRDVLPFAGKEGFVPESWCPDCAFYKLRRTPKKRDYSQY